MLRDGEPLVDRLWKTELAAEPLATPEQRAGLKQRLTDLAASIADASDPVTEYQAEFRRRYDELVTPARKPFVPFDKRSKGQWKPPIAPASRPTPRPCAPAGIDRVLAKAVLAGLIRHPAEIARHLEVLGSLRLADGALGRLFEAVVRSRAGGSTGKVP